jgi:hypothetical protein
MHSRLLTAKNHVEAFLCQVCYEALKASQRTRDADEAHNTASRIHAKATADRIYNERMASAEEILENTIASARDQRDALCVKAVETFARSAEAPTAIFERAKADALVALHGFSAESRELSNQATFVAIELSKVALEDVKDKNEFELRQARGAGEGLYRLFHDPFEADWLSAQSAYKQTLGEVTENFERCMRPLREACNAATREHDEDFELVNKPAQGAYLIVIAKTVEEWQLSHTEAEASYARQYKLIQAQYSAERRLHIETLRTGRNKADEYFNWMSTLASPEPKPAE